MRMIIYCICFSALRLGFEEEEYSGREGPDQLPCTVRVRLQDTIIESNLTFQVIPRTVPDNVDANGPLPTAIPIGANASRKSM